MFTWDTQKAIINYRKHGVTFREASAVFRDIRALDWVDLEHSDTELRFKRLGISQTFRIMIVVYTIRRTRNDKEEIRIISARQASKKERQAYAGCGY